MTLDEGKTVVALARSTLDAYVGGGGIRIRTWTSGILSEPRGVFVTINRAEDTPDRLRGCIGFPYPVKRLGDAVQEATIAAACEDPRFPPVRVEELPLLVVEVSILTPPEPLDSPRRQDVAGKVHVGKDGLIVTRSSASGLLLPQVATEFQLGAEDFLAQTCIKAGLAPDAWLDEKTRLQIFQAEIFGEKSPRGEINRLET